MEIASMDNHLSTQPTTSQGTDQCVEQAVQFLQAIFAPGDQILFRPIETWTESGRKKSKVDYEGIQYVLVGGKDQTGQWRPTMSGLIKYGQTTRETNGANQVQRLLRGLPSIWGRRPIRSGMADPLGTHPVDRR